MNDSPTSDAANNEMPSSPSPANSDSSSKVGRQFWAGGAWVTAGRTLGIGATIFVNFVLARILTPSDFGIFGLLISIVTTSSVVGMFGFNSGVVRFLAESLSANDPVRARRVLQITRAIAGSSIAIVSLSVIVGLALFHRRLFELHSPSTICALAGFATFFLSCNNLFAAILRGLDEPKLAILLGPQSAGGPVGAALFLALLVAVGFRWRTLESVMTLYVVAYALCVPIAVIWFRETVCRTLNSRLASAANSTMPEFTPRMAISICISLMLTQLLTIATREADLWIAGSFGASNDLGLYVAARRIMQTVAIPLGLVNLSVIALIPTLWRQKESKQLQNVLQTAANLATGISGVCLLVILIAPGMVLQVLFGSYYREGAVPLVILSLAQFVFTWTGACEMVLIMTGHERVALFINAFSTIAILGIGPIVTRQWGVVGLATLSSLIITCQNILQWLMVYQYLGIWTNSNPFMSRWRD